MSRNNFFRSILIFFEKGSSACKSMYIIKSLTLHTDTWVYKNSKHEFCVFASKHALLCKNRSSLNENCHWWWKSAQIELFLRPVNTSLHAYFTLEKPSFSMYLLSTQEHTIPLCVKILQILFWLELSWFWIEGNGRFWDFLTFYVPLCSKKLSVHCINPNH